VTLLRKLHSFAKHFTADPAVVSTPTEIEQQRHRSTIISDRRSNLCHLVDRIEEIVQQKSVELYAARICYD
jgi:hypothetical protein